MSVSYTHLEYDEVALKVTDEAVRAIAKKSLERKTGARGLRSIMEKAMMDVMYRIPVSYTHLTSMYDMIQSP